VKANLDKARNQAMDERLKVESENLARSWMQHESEWLNDYLVQGVEDPRINLQSIFSRQFLVRALFKEQFLDLMQQEHRFSACLNWLQNLARQEMSEPRDIEVVLHALRQGADSAEGLAIPEYIGRSFRNLPAQSSGAVIPNYLESFLERGRFVDGKFVPDQASINTFQLVWKAALSPCKNPADSDGLRVLEPACGSANDYRYLRAYGIADCLHYTGLDLCPKNIENAQALFPDAHFAVGNVFEIAAEDKTFERTFVHDLFEHLSLDGLCAAVSEVCRVTRLGICVSFFSMDEIPEHIVRPIENYHWNTLSLQLMRDLFANHGFAAQVINISAFLQRQLGCSETHNPNAYTFILWRQDMLQTSATSSI
jgi:SAM-dependent methyltransferase